MPWRRAHRIEGLRPFLAMDVMERAFALERAGERVLHLEIGEPDFAPPPEAIEACQRALREGETHYADSLGLPELRQSIADDLFRRHGAGISPEQVLVTSGTSPALLMVLQLLVDPGDEVILAAPHYPCYPNFIRVCGATPVVVPTDPALAYRLDPDAVRDKLSRRTRAILVGSPSNPTGAIQDLDSLRGLARLGVPLISDEIYDGLVYDGARAPSALEVDGDVFVLDGFSKRYAMTGFRLGYVVAPPDALRSLQILQQNLFISANRFVQHAGIAALRHGSGIVESARERYAHQRNCLIDGLRSLGLDVPAVPRGAFYVFADARTVDRDSLRLSFGLLSKARVAVTPGVDFGSEGEGWLRFCYATPKARIDEALERLAEALPKLVQS
ncbi:MAG: pyridoxal phosphate-dependent aminotransferase [Myxococcota bacterium]